MRPTNIKPYKATSSQSTQTTRRKDNLKNTPIWLYRGIKNNSILQILVKKFSSIKSDNREKFTPAIKSALQLLPYKNISSWSIVSDRILRILNQKLGII